MDLTVGPPDKTLVGAAWEYVSMVAGQYVRDVSITDLFGNNIVLRDLEPKNPAIHGLNDLRLSLNIPQDIVPRKNEPLYSRVVESFLRDVSSGKVKTVLYVGDSLHNDGNAIRNLSEQTPFNVIGYLCNDLRENVEKDLSIGEIIFSSNWGNLWKVYKEAKDRGLALATKLVGVFDLDQTVYAAKGRHDGPLKAARLEAVLKTLRTVIPPHRYDVERVGLIYRELDQDKYHPLTLDNQDYVVFLTLVLCLGIFDMQNVQQWLAMSTPITTIIDDAIEKAKKIAQHEDIVRALDSIREVFFNTRVGDQTPFKTFREEEYNTTRTAMLHRETDHRSREAHSRIPMTREVLDLVLFLKNQGSQVLALSDRPVEATEHDSQMFSGPKSLLEIPLTPLGNSIESYLHELR